MASARLLLLQLDYLIAGILSLLVLLASPASHLLLPCRIVERHALIGEALIGILNRGLENVIYILPLPELRGVLLALEGLSRHVRA